jgi:putative sterol carrier protein
MADATAEFFDGLARRGHEPLLAKTTGTMRVELVGGARPERWLIAVDAGDVAVSRRNARADCTIRCDRDLFARVATCEANAMAAVLRGAMTIDGDPSLLVVFQRLFSVPAR